MGKTRFVVCYNNRKEPKDNQGVCFSFLAIGNTKQQKLRSESHSGGGGTGSLCSWLAVCAPPTPPLPPAVVSQVPTCEVKGHREAGVCGWNG